MPGFLGFKCYLNCKLAIPVSDGHNQCVCCLGDTHIAQKCQHCLKLTARTRRARDLQLKLLMEKSPTTPGQTLPTTASDRGPSSTHPSEQPAKKLSNRQAPLSPTQESAKKCHSTSGQSAPAPTALSALVAHTVGPSSTASTSRARDSKRAGSDRGTKGKSKSHVSAPPIPKP
ncbi:hypothetical protein KIL84_010800 [Mauremys mutica]|uniref:Uncharacterized protein n=1 Tax=Mauremys mutica TaxID=74926 RepID=A0A9D3XCZ6_9SAUR|nr:hypothetical protein KIL84_010800 [Mauremys mutica]